MKKKENKIPFALKAFIILVIASFIADAIDIVAYRRFMIAHGVGWFDAPGWKLTFEYLFSFPGNVITILGLSPWVIALVYLSWPQRLKAKDYAIL